MIKAVDGPAAGQVLALRVPVPPILRVVFNTLAKHKDRAWDALNCPEDEVREQEEVWAYIIVDKPTAVHIKMSPRSLSGFYVMGELNLLLPQPPEGVMRNNYAWGQWLRANWNLRPEWAKKEHVR